MNNINEILEKIDENTLNNLISTIRRTPEFSILKKKTQIKNSAVEKNEISNNKITNRQEHSSQVSEVAYKIVKESGRTEKEALVAELVGLCHDLGHTPFGHDGEMMFTEKTGKPFYHAKYGAKLFEKVFHKVLNSKHPRTGKDTFKQEAKESLEQLQTYVQAGIFSEDIIQNVLGLSDFIKSGVSFHQEGYYTFEMDKKLEQLRKKHQETGKYNEELDLLEKALENPCVYAGMLADTISIMQSDTRDMMNTKNPYDDSKTVISIEDQLQVAKKVGFTPENITKMQEQLLKIGKVVDIDGLDENEALHKILETLGQVNVTHIQKMVAQYTGEQGLNNKGRFQSVSDEYKMFADNYKAKYEEYIGKKLTQEEWETTRDNGLQEQRYALKEKNPILCLTYEIQNSLMYGKILNRENIKILDNDLDRNKAIFSRTYDYLYKISMAKTSELTSPEEIALKQEMNEMYKSKQYPKQFGEVGRDRRISKSQIIKNLTIFKMQQMGNLDLKDFYQEHIGSQENNILAQIEQMEAQGKNEDEILQQLSGINPIAYSDFKRRDAKKIQDIENLRNNSKTDEEIALKLGMEKRDFEELMQGKSFLKRYIEYRMTFDEIIEISENDVSLEQENNLDTLEIDEISPFDLVAEMHDQKSEQFFEDKKSGKYNVPPLLGKVIADSMETVTSKDMTFVSQDVMKENRRELQTEVSQER